MYTVLIAEDSKPILRNIKMLLQSGELPISIVGTASNGQEALASIQQQPVDILITDIRMPKLDGMALIQQARQLLPHLQVVLISGYSDFEYTRKALSLEVFDYLLKPVEREQLLEVMGRLVQRLRDKHAQHAQDFEAQLRAARPYEEPLLSVTSFLDMIEKRQKERFSIMLEEQLSKRTEEDWQKLDLEKFVLQLAEAFWRASPLQDASLRKKLEHDAKQLLSAPSFEQFTKALIAWSEQCFEAHIGIGRKSAAELFQQIDDFVKQNMYSHISISDLAERFHVSPSYISRIVKQFAKDTFVRYYLKLKMETACKIMNEKPDIKMKDLAEILSFSDQHYFSKVFKEYVGCSPTAYRERIECGSSD